jgi:hypothetical protein
VATLEARPAIGHLDLAGRGGEGTLTVIWGGELT